MSSTAKLTAQVAGVGALLAAVTTAITQAEALAEVQPFVLKYQLVAQQRELQSFRTLERIDALDFQITVLENQLAVLRKQHAGDLGDESLADQLRRVDEDVLKKSKERDLLKCLVLQRQTCTQ